MAARRYQPEAWIDAGTLKAFDQVLLPKLKARLFNPPSTILMGGSRSKTIEIAFEEATWRMIGLYLAEGGIGPDGRTVQFTFGAHEGHHADLVRRWGDRYGVNHHTAHGAGTLIVYLFGKALADWLAEHFGNGAFHKKLPDWIMSAPIPVQMPLLEHYFRGDGCFWDESRGAIAATTRSQELARQVQLVLLWAGFATSLDTMEDAGEPRYRVSVGGAAADRLADAWHVKIPVKGAGRSARYNHIQATEEDFVAFPVRSITTEPYQGEVINLEVDEDHSYCVPFIAHNCWIEKDALVGVIQGVCQRNDVPFFSCRGYTSQSEMWSAAQRLLGYLANGQTPLIIHLGDHDPSGIDMTRDITDRLALFLEHEGYSPADVQRIALNMDQIERYDPPPNPAKLTDSRASSYVREHGDDSWELDALDPTVMASLIEGAIHDVRDDLLWNAKVQEDEEGRRLLSEVSQHWDYIVDELEDGTLFGDSDD